MERKNTIIFDLIMTNQCNRRCEYCCIDFNDNFASKAILDDFNNILSMNSVKADNYLVNFFGGEPLLKYENIVYLVNKLPRDKIAFSIGTNGKLLSKDKMDFFSTNAFNIFLTINDNNFDLLDKKSFFKEYLDIIEINYVVSPNNIGACMELGILENLVSYGFKKINIIPVFVTMKWETESLKILKKLVDQADEIIAKKINANLLICKFSYFDGMPECPLFVIDANGNIYQDLSDELYIGKQFRLMSKGLKDEIEKDTFLGNISELGSMDNLISRYSLEKILKLIHKIPKDLGHLENNIILHRIMNTNFNYRKGKGYDVFTNDLKQNRFTYDK